MVVSCCLLHSLFGHPFLIADARLDLDRSGALAPLLMGAVLAGLTLWLARQEFRMQLPGRKIKKHRMIRARASHPTLDPCWSA